MNSEDLLLLQKKVRALRAEGNYKKTIETSHFLLEKGTEVNDHKSILVAHLHMAVSYYCIGDIEDAFYHIGVYEELCSKNGDEEDLLQLYNVLFLLYDFIKDNGKAKATLEKSINLGEKLEKYNIVSNGYSNYSHILIVEDNYVDALNMAKKGLRMAKLHQPASPILELRVKLNIAKAYIGLEDFHSSKTLIDEMMNDPILDSFIREKSNCYQLQGHWYSEQFMYNEALLSLTNAKNLVESYHDVYLLKTIQDDIRKLCELTNNIQLGYTVQKEYIALLEEISQRELAMTALKHEIKLNFAAIERKANIDFLTGLYNRKYLESTTNKWLKQASMTKENIVCIAFDIDHFKSINDTYGHLLGDEVIKQVGQTLTKLFGHEDLIARYGGDEFVIILKDSSLTNGTVTAEQILHTLRNFKIAKDSYAITITVSIGVADNLQGGLMNFNDLFHVADKELYRAKQHGKNQVCVII